MHEVVNLILAQKPICTALGKSLNLSIFIFSICGSKLLNIQYLIRINVSSY